MPNGYAPLTRSFRAAATIKDMSRWSGALGRGGLCLLMVAGTLFAVAPSASAAFPGSNGLIAWTHVTGLTTPSQVFVVGPDGGRVRQLTHGTQNVFNPAWSPDGRTIAFDSSSADDVDVWLLDRPGGPRDLTNDPGFADVQSAWSPDGTRLVFSRQSPFTGIGGLWLIDIDGSDMHQLTPAPGYTDQQPAWSPEGRWIVFSSSRDGNLELYAVHPDGGGLRRVTRTPLLQEENPNWAPDGSRVAFDACRAASFPCPGSANYDVFTMAPDGSGLTRLTDAAAIDANPAWSPDGTKIAFRSDRTGWTQIWKMNADGSGQTQLTFKNFQGGVDPDWQAR